MRVFLTGGTGYIGQRVAEAILSKGHDIVLLVRPSSDTSYYNGLSSNVTIIRDGDEEASVAIQTNVPDIGIHIATSYVKESTPEAERTMIEANVVFPSKWLAKLISYGCTTFINTATYWEQSDRAPHGPINIYAASKAAFRSIIDGYVQEHRVRAITLRLFDVYGPLDPRPKIFNLVADAAANGEKLITSKGNQILFFTHIDDVVSGYLGAISRIKTLPLGTNETFDLRGKGCTLRDAVEVFQSISKSVAPIDWGGREYDPHQIMNPVLHPTLKEWHPKYSLEAGLKEIVEAND